MCLSDSNFDGYVDGADLAVLKKEYGRVDCACKEYLYGDDLCQKYFDLYVCCINLSKADRRVDYSNCKQKTEEDDCETAGCYWNSSNGACMIDMCLSDSDFDGYVDGDDLAVLKKDYGRVDCPACD
jgi:hypothetical protein